MQYILVIMGILIINCYSTVTAITSNYLNKIQSYKESRINDMLMIHRIIADSHEPMDIYEQIVNITNRSDPTRNVLDLTLSTTDFLSNVGMSFGVYLFFLVVVISVALGQET